MKRVKIMAMVAAVIIGATFASCGNNSSKIDENNKPKQEVVDKKAYSKELAMYFNSEKESKNNYAGLGEFGFISMVDDVNKSDDKMEIFITNTYLDMSAGESGKSKEDLTKKCIYTIDHDGVKEKKVDDTEQVSLIQELLIMKSDMKEGSGWKQNVMINGESHSAQTTIVEMGEDSEGRKFVSMEIEVDGVKGYSKDEKYKEKRTYTEGIGITDFSVNYLGYNDETFEFSYHLVVFDKE